MSRIDEQGFEYGMSTYADAVLCKFCSFSAVHEQFNSLICWWDDRCNVEILVESDSIQN